MEFVEVKTELADEEESKRSLANTRTIPKVETEEQSNSLSCLNQDQVIRELKGGCNFSKMKYTEIGRVQCLMETAPPFPTILAQWSQAAWSSITRSPFVFILDSHVSARPLNTFAHVGPNLTQDWIYGIDQYSTVISLNVTTPFLVLNEMGGGNAYGIQLMDKKQATRFEKCLHDLGCAVTRY